MYFKIWILLLVAVKHQTVNSFEVCSDFIDFDKVQALFFVSSSPTAFIENALKNDLNQTKVSHQCVATYINSTKTGQGLDRLTKTMDATSRIPAGVLRQMAHWFGVPEECYKVKRDDGTQAAHFCSVDIHLYGECNLTVEVCAFKECLENDITTFTNEALKTFKLFMKKDIPLNPVVRTRCKENDTKKPMTIVEMLAFVAFGVWTLILVTATVLDYTEVCKSRKCSRLITAVSLLANGKRLFTLSKSTSKTDLTAFHGIKVISASWVILGHHYGYTPGFLLQNPMELLETVAQIYYQFLVNTVLSVDTFFVMSGILITYHGLEHVQMVSPKMWVWFVMQRLLRFWIHIAALLLGVQMLRFFGSGPIFDQMIEVFIGMCDNNWWKPLFFVNNLGPETPLEMCMVHTWYLCVDIQFFIFTPLVLILLKRAAKLGVFLLFNLMAASVFFIMTTSMIFNISPTPQVGIHIVESSFWPKIYFKPLTHLAPYCVGLLVGVYLHHVKKNPKWKNETVLASFWIRVLGWVFASISLLSAVLGGYVWRLDTTSLDLYWPLSFVYGGLCRTAWSLGVAWVVVTTALGYSKPINVFLSWDGFKWLSRLTFTAYLIHVPVIIMDKSLIRTNVYFSSYNMMMSFLGVLFLSFGLALVATLAIEQPVGQILGLFFDIKPHIEAVKKVKSPEMAEKGAVNS